ncbi:MAG: YgeY family selenium metabolism-linked hydrolase [Anaerolineaceae bacterium]|nr:YgeY family selenium metabolism-linked hydrolase [Anaerolineaceae bacterium]
MENNALIEFTRDLIRIRSLSGEEGSVVERIVLEMNHLGYDDAWIDQAGNALGLIQGHKPGKCILLDGHVDTVSANPDDWNSDPFAADIRDGRIYGRGSADTKGNLAAMVYGASQVDREQLIGSILVCGSVHEEVMEGGSLQLVIKENQPDYVVIGEATNLHLNRGGRGRAEVVVETIGKSAHSSSPEVGVCAVHIMMRLIEAIESLPSQQHPFLGSGSMVLTDIISDPYPGSSVLPNRCRVTFDRRLLLDETIDSVVSTVKQCAQSANIECVVTVLNGKETTYRGYQMQAPKFFPAWLLEEEHPLVQQAYQVLTELNPQTEIKAFRFCTNAASSAGLFGIPTIGFGLGKETDAHTVDESISIEELYQAARGYQAIIQAVLR